MLTEIKKQSFPEEKHFQKIQKQLLKKVNKVAKEIRSIVVATGDRWDKEFPSVKEIARTLTNLIYELKFKPNETYYESSSNNIVARIIYFPKIGAIEAPGYLEGTLAYIPVQEKVGFLNVEIDVQFDD